jgi:hypothetical protein
LKKPQVADFREQIGATFQLNEEKKEIDFFHKFFPVSLVEKIVAETNAYAVKCIQVRPDKVWVPRRVRIHLGDTNITPNASIFRFINI